MEKSLNQESKDESKLGFLDIAVILLSLYVLTALLVDTFLQLDPEVSNLLGLIDNMICVFFFIEFAIRLYRAESKLDFMRWGWIDLLSSIPMLDYFRFGRMFRLIRIFRVLRAIRSFRYLRTHLFRKRVQGAFSSVVLFAGLMLIFSSIAILQVENDPSGNIKSAEDAIWWAYVTITTVGYGDKYPVTTEGRMIAVILMTTGVGLFGTFTGFVASWFVEGKNEERMETKDA